MEAKGQIKDIRHYGRWRITFDFEHIDIVSLNELVGKDLRVKVELWKDKRSLNANAFAWVLMQKIAEKINSDKWSVYLDMLQRYSRSFTHIIVKPQAVKAVMDMCRTAIDLGEILVDGEKGHQLQVYFGSSQFDTAEMSVFLNGIVSECKELGIDTLPPGDVERMVENWDKK